MATLTDIVEQLKINNVGIENTSKNIDALVKGLERSRLDNLEDKLDKSRAKKVVPERSKAFQAGENLTKGFDVGFLMNPAKLLAPLLAGVTAFGAGLLGLRGWEKGAITSIGNGLKTLSNSALDGAKNLRTSILGKLFGIEVDPKSGLAKSSDTTKKGLAIFRPLSEVVSERLTSLRTGFLNAFGIGADGKPIQDPRNKMKVSATGDFITKATARITRLLNPIMKVSTGIADFIKGAGSGLFKFLDPFISGAKGFAKLFSKILWPVGVIMSLFESVTAYQEEDGSKFDKFKAGFGTFFADFIGAPLDLLKNGMVWILKNLLGLESDEDGKIKSGQGLTGDALAIIQTFSFKDTIKSLIDGIFGMYEAAFKWFGDLFSGEKSIGESLTILFKNWLGASTSMVDWIYNKAIAPITEWVASKFGIELDLPELDLMKTLSDTYARIKNGFMSSMESLTIWFMTMPKRIGLSLEEEWVYAMQKLKVGFVKFGDWVAGLPDSIFLGALQKIKDTVPNWAAKAMGLDESIKGAKLNISNREEITSAAMERIDYDTAKRLGEINTKRDELEALTMALNDARQYNSTTNNGSIALQQNTATVDVLNGGSFDAIGGP